MTKTEAKELLAEMMALIKENADPNLDNTARIEKVGAFKDKYEKLDKGIDETYETLDKTQERLYKATLAPDISKEKPENELEEKKTDFDSMAADFIRELEAKKGH